MTNANPQLTAERALQQHAAQVQADLCAQDASWGRSGWTRRRFIGGAGMVGAAALASQLVTTRVAFGATPSATGAASTDRTVVVIFMRGAADGLRILVPNSAALGLTYLREVRENLVPGDDGLVALPGTAGWAINSQLQPLYDALWATGELAFVPGVSSPGISRSHFQAQQYIERGGSDSATTGWLDRTLEQLGAGTTFRAVAVGDTTPLSLLGGEPSLALTGIDDFVFPGWSDVQAGSQAAVASLYRGLGGSLGEDVANTIAALGTANTIRNTPVPDNGVVYPDGDLSDSLKSLATILRAEVGLQVATVDVGGWDTHTDEVNDLDGHLGNVAATLAAFMADLGTERRKRVTVVLQTEFGRRVEMNASGGTDHGHGSLMWLLGGGLSGSGVFGKWTQLTASTLDDGDVPGVNNPFDVLGEVVQKRLNTGSLSSVFPGHAVAPLGVATTT